MSWEDEIKRRDAKPVVCVEIALDSGVLFYADRDFREGTTFWEGRVLDVSPINRGVDLNGNSLLIDDVTITLNNNDPNSATGSGHFATIAPPYESWEGKDVFIYLKFIATDGTIYTKQVFAGLCIPKEFTPENITIEARPAIRESVNLLQRSIKGTEFSGYSVPDESVGQALNIILGTVSSNKGAVFCPMIDDTDNNEKFCVAQHAVKSVDSVYRKRADVLTQLSLTTHYTVTKSATDIDSKKYSYIQLTSGTYSDGDEIYVNVKGLEGNGNGTGVLYENPVSAFKQLLLQFTEEQLSSSDIDSTSFSAAETTCTSRTEIIGTGGYAKSGYFGTCIPFENSGNRLETSDDPWGALQAIAKGFHHQVYITTEGKIGLTSIDITASEVPSVYYREKDGDFIENVLPKASYRPTKTVNERRSRWKVAQSVQNGTQGFTRGYNTTSQIGIGIREADTVNRTAQNDEVLQDILQREMSLSAGNAVLIQWTVPGLWGLQADSDVGDYVGMTHKRVLQGLNEQPLQVTSVNADLMNGTTTLQALGVQDGFILGNVAVESIATQQETFTITASIDTYVDSGAQGTPHTSDTTLNHGSYIIIDTNEVEPESLIIRSAFRFATTSASGTVLSATLRLYVTAVYSGGGDLYYYYESGGEGPFFSHIYPASGTPSLVIHRLNETTWNESDNYGNFGATSWSDSLITTAYSNSQIVTTGYMQFNLNSSAISYIQTQVTAGNPVELTLNAIAQGYTETNPPNPLYSKEYFGTSYDTTQPQAVNIASSEHTTIALRPTLIIVALV